MTPPMEEKVLEEIVGKAVLKGAELVKDFWTSDEVKVAAREAARLAWRESSRRQAERDAGIAKGLEGWCAGNNCPGSNEIARAILKEAEGE